HVPLKDLPSILNKIYLALKSRGIVYCSFKYGNFEGVRNGRYFTDFTEEKFNKLIKNEELFDIVETRVTSDVRKGRENEKWLNIILEKK
ncbi:MAG: SAM-dependent methyltransferase, partial [Sphaerochaetaceae bacterium]